MTVDVAQQGRALCQALLLGGAMGVVYDLFRILRVRVKVRLLGPLLDLLFWLAATAALFVWSQSAWGGQVRLYGAAFCLAGGALYFWALSPFFLRLGYLGADLAAALLGILTFPLGAAEALLKKIRKIVKNVFLSWTKWYRIRATTERLDAAARRRTLRERGENVHDLQTSRFSDQDRRAGTADLHGHLSAGSEEKDPGRSASAGRSVPAGDRPAFGKQKAGRRHRKQRRP
jgi:tryptophan-rich sensory protein